MGGVSGFVEELGVDRLSIFPGVRVSGRSNYVRFDPGIELGRVHARVEVVKGCGLCIFAIRFDDSVSENDRNVRPVFDIAVQKMSTSPVDISGRPESD